MEATGVKKPHFVLEHTGDKFSRKHHEAYCYLAEWITAWVYRQLKKAKIKVSI